MPRFLNAPADKMPPCRFIPRKRVAYIDEQGNRVDPKTPNATKFERFIFDLVPQAQRTLVVEGDPAEWFAPVKNPPGEKIDAADMTQAALVKLHRGWLEAAGVRVAPNVPVEISPLYALDADQVKLKITPGTVIEKPVYIRD